MAMADHPQVSKRWRGVWLALLVLIAGAIWLVRQESPIPAGSQPAVSLPETVKQVREWIDPWLTGGVASAEWSYRWDGQATGAGLSALGERLGLPPAAQTSEGYVSRRQIGEASWTLWHDEPQFVHQEDDVLAFVLLLEMPPGLSREELAELADRTATGVAEGGIEARWSLSFRGVSDSEETVQRIADAAGARLVERYEDSGSSSSTYYTDRVQRSAFSGEARVNLQLASHYDRLSGRYTIAGGIPLITGDYSARDY
ncbi:YwmB family TATA-box binding protein [Paenibacillus sp. 1P07SE]|uniref:YwmB family TATA-box binding protein n=1 Tax=Paenibacillus sp. 1P07SE TaxID=3132209 RepID=UPI0039A6C17D